MINIEKKLEFWAHLKPTELAFVDGKKEITFAQLYTHTLKITTVLKEPGISAGDLVCTMLPAYLDWPVTLALQILDATSFAKPNDYNFDEYAQPKWLLTVKEHKNFSKEKTIIIDQNFAELVNEAAMFIVDNQTSDALLPMRLSSTSGTTGEVKYLAFSESELMNRIQAPTGVTYMGNGKFLNLFPFGASSSHNWALRLLVEGKTYFMSTQKDESITTLLLGKKLKTIIGSPRQMGSFLDVLGKEGIKLDNSYNLLLAGSTPSPSLLNRIRRDHDTKIFNNHGSAETGFISMCDVTNEDSPGLLIHPDFIVQILDENETELEPNQNGLIRYQVPSAATSYFNNPSASEKIFRSGFFYSGDMGYKSDDGRLYITGRSNDIINLGGVKINPAQLDELALEQVGVQDAAAFAFEDESGIPKLAIALVVDHEFIEDIFRGAIAVGFRVSKLEKITLLDSIPRNPNGKILRRELG